MPENVMEKDIEKIQSICEIIKSKCQYQDRRESNVATIIVSDLERKGLGLRTLHYCQEISDKLQEVKSKFLSDSMQSVYNESVFNVVQHYLKLKHPEYVG